MKDLKSKEELTQFLLKNKVELTGFIGEVDEDMEYNDIIKNKNEYCITEHMVISKKEKESILKYYDSIEKFAKEHNIDFISEKINGNSINFIHLSDIRKEQSIRKNGLLCSYCSYEADLGFGIYAIESNCYKGLDNLKSFFEDYEKEEVLVIKGIYNSSYTKCIYGQGHEGYIVLEDDVPPTKLSMEIMNIDDFLLL